MHYTTHESVETPVARANFFNSPTELVLEMIEDHEGFP